MQKYYGRFIRASVNTWLNNVYYSFPKLSKDPVDKKFNYTCFYTSGTEIVD